jgi:hypothetical protein
MAEPNISATLLQDSANCAHRLGDVREQVHERVSPSAPPRAVRTVKDHRLIQNAPLLVD